MSTDRGVLSVSAEGGVKFLLSSDEGFVSFVIKLDVSEDGSYDEGPDLFDRGIDSDGPLGFGECDFRGLDLFEVDFEGPDERGFSEEIGPVVHAVEFVVEFFLLGILLNRLFNLDSELESKIIELFEGVLFAHKFVETVLFYFEVWHCYRVGFIKS